MHRDNSRMGSTPTKTSTTVPMNAGSSSGNRGRDSSREDDRCVGCETKFTIITRKMRCEHCRSSYCGDCWKANLQFRGVNSPVYINSAVTTTCKRCKILNGPVYDWNELMELKVRDLKEFLRSKHVETSKCVSKEDLVELIRQSCSSDAFFRAQVEHQRRVALMIMRFQEDASGSRKPEYDADALLAAQIAAAEDDALASHAMASSATSDIPRTSQGGTSSSSFAVNTENSGSSSYATNSQCHSDQKVTEERTTTLPTSDSAQHSAAQGDSVHPSQTETSFANGYMVGQQNSYSGAGVTQETSASQQSSTEAWRQRAPHERVLINEITCEEHLSELSSKQMKDILAFNFVDYRGVLERSELLDLVRTLWRSRNNHVEQPTTNRETPDVISETATVPSKSTIEQSAAEREVNDRELCKICMEREIDCVLLECGHLVTCTECGRVLADCPICRRYVARVVHIFKS